MDGLGQLSSFVSSTKLVCAFHKIHDKYNQKALLVLQNKFCDCNQTVGLF